MKQIWNWIKNNPNRAMFLVPILLVAGISISHVVTWYDMANPINWAIYLSIAIEVAAITALVAATNKIKGGIWFMFGIVTFIQMVGNIFFSYKEIDANGELFKSWVELTGPIWELMGTELTDVVGMKRWLAFLEGGLLPIISLTSLHFFVKYEKPEEKTPLSEEADRVWEKVKELKKEGKLTEPTEEDIKDEPTALANSKYRNEIEEEWDEDHALDMVMNDMVNSLSEKEISELFDEQPDNTKLEENSSDTIEPIVDSQVELEKQMNEEVSKTVEKVDNELIENALKKYKESRGESMEKVTPKELKERIENKTTVNQPMKSGKTNIKRID